MCVSTVGVLGMPTGPVATGRLERVFVQRRKATAKAIWGESTGNLASYDLEASTEYDNEHVFTFSKPFKDPKCLALSIRIAQGT